MARAKKAAASGRGSPEAVAKRKAARALNSIFDNRGSAAASGIDGRSARRRERLLKELKEGRNGQALKALDALAAISELFKLGETPATIRKLKPKLPPVPEMSEGNASAFQEAQHLYNFDPRAWKVLGVELDGATAEGEGGVAKKSAKKRGRPPKKAGA